MKIAFTLNQMDKFSRSEHTYRTLHNLVQGYNGIDVDISPKDLHHFVFVAGLFTVYTEEDTGVEMISIRRNEFNLVELEKSIFAHMFWVTLRETLAFQAYKQQFDFAAVRQARKQFIEMLDSIEW